MSTNGSGATVPDEGLEIRGNAGMYALVTVAATAAASAYAYRAVYSGGAVNWVVTVLLGGIAVMHAAAWWDARAPRLVADAQGIRLRHGRRWSGTPWEEVETVEVGRSGGLLRDGELRIRTGDRVQSLRYGIGARASRTDLPGTLRTLGAPVAAVPKKPGAPRHAAQATEPVEEQAPVPAAPRLVSPSEPAGTGRAVRADVRRDGPASLGTLALQPGPALLPEIKELRGTSGRVGLVLETVVAATGRSAVTDTAVDAAPVDPYPTQPAEEPVIGPQLAAARQRLRLSVDELADRTRIRPHVIESIDVDDFVPCGGDFYARGHIRALARVLGVDPGPLVAAYDERYASAPIAARRIFEAELASGPAPSLRATRGGPNWAALLGMVMVLAIVWGVAKMLMPADPGAAAPVVQPTPSAAITPTPAPDTDRFAGVGEPPTNRVTLSAQGGTSAVTVRDDAGALIWRGSLDAGESHTVRVVGSATVVAADGGVVKASVNGDPRGLLGDAGQTVQRVLRGADPR